MQRFCLNIFLILFPTNTKHSICRTFRPPCTFNLESSKLAQVVAEFLSAIVLKLHETRTLEAESNRCLTLRCNKSSLHAFATQPQNQFSHNWREDMCCVQAALQAGTCSADRSVICADTLCWQGANCTKPEQWLDWGSEPTNQFDTNIEI